MTNAARIAVLSISLALTGLTASAQFDTLELPFRTLTIKDGLSQGMVNRITQDRYGFMWFATKDGLNRYDGYHFKVYRNKPGDSTSIAENYITVVQEDPQGRLWVGTSSKGLDVFFPESETFRHMHLGADGDASLVTSLVCDHDGNIWAATTKGLYKITFAPASGPTHDRSALPPYTVHRYFNRQCRVTLDHAGHLWGYLISSHSFRITPAANGADRIDTIDMTPLVTGPWNADLNTNVNGLFVEDPTTHRIYGIHPYFIAEYDTLTLLPRIILRIAYPDGDRLELDQALIDETNQLWIGATQLWRVDLRTSALTHILSADPNQKRLLGNTVSVYMDRNATVWIGTTGYGVLQYDRRIERFNLHPDASMHWMSVTTDDRIISLRQETCLAVYDLRKRAYSFDLSDQAPVVNELFTGLTEETPAAVQDADGTFWMCKGDLFSYREDTKRFTRHRIMNERGEPVRRRRGSFPLMLEGQAALWFGCDSALYRFDKATQRFRSFRYPIPPVYSPYSFAQAIHPDAQGRMWVATLKGLLRLDPATGRWDHFKHDPQDPSSISFDIIFSILPDPIEPERYLWLGTNGGGLNRFEMANGHCDRFTVKDGLPNDVIYGILDDADGNLWMSTNKGLSRFSPTTGVFRNYNEGDGLQSDEFNRNAFCKLSDGTLLFGGVGGFNSFNPRDLKDDHQPVNVRITDIKLMNRSIAFGTPGSPLQVPAYMSEGMEIPYGANMVTFEFAAMSYAAPERHQYRYMLVGFDPDWITAGDNNSAVYTNLDPGTYTFRVRGANRDGIWDEQGTTFKLVVRPPWWMAWWFFTLCVIAVSGSILIYIRYLRSQRAKLEMTVFVRTHELSREKDRSDELLKNILPVGVANELKRMGQAAARHYEQVTVLFSDFKDFTGVSEQLSPTELVEELNVCFNAFDRIMEKYGIEKIKTIGDAYMAAGGVPDPTEGMPLSVVRAGLEMQAIMAERRAERHAMGKPSFDMRLGIHTGPVVAGIVGRRKFQYDIWGDTVNIASRMESSGEVGEVNISGATYELVRRSPGLNFISRGRIEAKGKGELEMFFVRSTAAHTTLAPGMSDHRNGPARTQVPVRRNSDMRDLRILLAEDNSFNVMVAQDELEFAIPGVKIDVATNGQEAVDQVIRNQYDVVLMDVQMPIMDGYQSTRAIRALKGPKAQLPIVALTANVMKAEVDRCMEAGMNAFVPKPFKREELIAALVKVLNEPDPAP